MIVMISAKNDDIKPMKIMKIITALDANQSMKQGLTIKTMGMSMVK